MFRPGGIYPVVLYTIFIFIILRQDYYLVIYVLACIPGFARHTPFSLRLKKCKTMLKTKFVKKILQNECSHNDGTICTDV